MILDRKKFEYVLDNYDNLPKLFIKHLKND